MQMWSVAESKGKQSEQITCRISCSLKAKSDKLVKSGDYSSMTDLVESALHYYLNRYELRQDTLHQVIDEIDKKFDEKLMQRLYSPETEQLLLGIIRIVVQQVMKEIQENR